MIYIILNMKDVAVKYKDRVLLKNMFEQIQATAKMVKHALFYKWSIVIKDALVLDLFCGAVAIDIEAI